MPEVKTCQQESTHPSNSDIGIDNDSVANTKAMYAVMQLLNVQQATQFFSYDLKGQSADIQLKQFKINSIKAILGH